VTPRVGIVILAAGESSRLGAPKQLLKFRGETLIHRVVNAALTSICRPVFVVLGANAEAIEREIPGEAKIVHNDRWAEGMGTSIARGIDAIYDQADAVILMLCDQPLITSEILNAFAAKAEVGLVAAEYNGTIGVPALFAKEVFPELRALNGKEGAKKILLENEARVVRIPCPEAAVDIDTAADFQRLQTSKQKS
jgi:molybdenum cofactor cytidylyltransferase